jgi:hypothetical protein
MNCIVVGLCGWRALQRCFFPVPFRAWLRRLPYSTTRTEQSNSLDGKRFLVSGFLPDILRGWKLGTDQWPQPSSEVHLTSPHTLRYPRRGGEPGESPMPYGDSFDVTSSDLLPTSNCVFTGVDGFLEVRPLNMYALRLVPRPCIGATLGLERINRVGASVSHMFDLTSVQRSSIPFLCPCLHVHRLSLDHQRKTLRANLI